MLSAATRMDESAMAVVAVIEHGVKKQVHPDVLTVADTEFGRITISYTTGPDGTPVDEHLAHVARRPPPRPCQLAQRGEAGGGLAVSKRQQMHR